MINVGSKRNKCNLLNVMLNVLGKIAGKTKIDRIRSQQIREYYGIQQVNEWVE